MQIKDFDSLYSVKTPDTIKSELQSSCLSDHSVECLSFHTGRDLVSPSHKKEASLAIRKMSSSSSSCSDSSSNNSSDYKMKQNVIEKIEQDVKEYKLATIQRINAKNILKSGITKSNSLVDHFLRQIEEYVLSMKNFDLMTEILTKESDYQFQFRNMLLLANRNID